MERTVTVWGKPNIVQISQLARTAFTASGAYQGQMVHARGHTASAALAAWAAKAKSSGQKRA